MAYYKDLTPFTYGAGGPGVNVGWLDAGHTFSTGPCPPGFYERLVERCRTPVHIYRGMHFCPFCKTAAGNGQIHVRHNGETYIAPILVAHYVSEHGYRPPDAFIQAVLAEP